MRTEYQYLEHKRTLNIKDSSLALYNQALKEHEV